MASLYKIRAPFIVIGEEDMKLVTGMVLAGYLRFKEEDEVTLTAYGVETLMASPLGGHWKGGLRVK